MPLVDARPPLDVLLDPEPDRVARPRERSRSPGDVGDQRIGVVVAELVGHVFLVVQHQTVAGSTSRSVEGDSGPGEHGEGLGELGDETGIGEGARGHDPAECVHVAETTLPELEIGTEREGDLTMLLMQQLGAFGEPGHAPVRIGPPQPP